jgi:hypothetical protein
MQGTIDVKDAMPRKAVELVWERGRPTIQASVSRVSESCSRCWLFDVDSPSQQQGRQASR